MEWPNNQEYGHGLRHLHAFPLDSEGWTLPILMSHFLYCRKVYLIQNVSYMATLSSKDWLARRYCHFCDGTQQPPFCFWKFNTSCIFPDCRLRKQFLSPVLSADNLSRKTKPKKKNCTANFYFAKPGLIKHVLFRFIKIGRRRRRRKQGRI